MKHPNSIRRILVAAAALVAVGALTFGATACTSATSSAPVQAAQAAAPAPAAPALATPAAPAAASAPAAAAAPAAATAAVASGPTAADGKKVLQSSCIGRCHQSDLLNHHFSTAKATSIASDMGREAGLNSDQKAAVVAYFAQ